MSILLLIYHHIIWFLMIFLICLLISKAELDRKKVRQRKVSPCIEVMRRGCNSQDQAKARSPDPIRVSHMTSRDPSIWAVFP